MEIIFIYWAFKFINDRVSKPDILDDELVLPLGNPKEEFQAGTCGRVSQKSGSVGIKTKNKC